MSNSTDTTSSGTAAIASSVEIVDASTILIAPAFALAQGYVTTAHTLGLQLLSQPAIQQQAAATANAVVATASTQLLAVDLLRPSPAS